MPRFPIEEWMGGQLRLTTFVSARISANIEELWESVTGAVPDESSSNPKKGTSEASGAYGPGKLLLRVQPDRLDWLMNPEDIDPESPPADPFRSLGPWHEGVAALDTLAATWLVRPDLPPIERIAFGSVLLHRENTKEAGYERLGDYIPVRPPADASDFLYQINHPVMSGTGIANLQINRLSKWSTVVFRAVAFSLALGRATVAPVEQTAAYAMRLELDINTAPDFPGPIPADRLVDVYRELVDLGRGIAAEGPRP
ncbi:MAG: hypothetical protein HY655_06665 [Acidobacteria bacterium]|nr:hypothetical protein [Acidobacteriota bacterium]